MTEQEVGVGPWEGLWPDGDHYDPELLERGDRRNVVDRYRYWRLEAIVADLDIRRHPFHVAVENLQHDFNIGSIVRTANAFCAAEVHVVGRRRWNRRGAMVTDRYQHVRHHEDVAALRAWADEAGLPLVGLENTEGSVPLETYAMPRDVVLVFGQEGPGLSPQMAAACDVTVSIAQFGSTRSINVGAAAAIAMHAWVREHADRRSASITIEQVDPAGPPAREAMAAYFAELDERFPTGFSADDDDPSALRPPAGAFLVAVSDGRAVACGGLQTIGDRIAEIKRMWVEPDWRGLGLGGRMLRSLEAAAARRGDRIVRLDTNAVLHDAIAMYRAAGYREIERYNDNPYAQHWFEKDLEREWKASADSP